MANCSFVSVLLEGDIDRIRDFVKKLKYNGEYSLVNVVDEKYQAELKIFPQPWVYLQDFKAKKLSDNQVALSFYVRYCLAPAFYQHLALYYPDIKVDLEEFNEFGYYIKVTVENGNIKEEFYDDPPWDEDDEEE